MIGQLIKNSLETLGFPNAESIPNLGLIKKNNLNLSIEKHPDKNWGVDRGVVGLQQAFQHVSSNVLDDVKQHDIKSDNTGIKLNRNLLIWT